MQDRKLAGLSKPDICFTDMTIVLVRSNPINPDSRLEKEAEALGEHGYHVSILGWGRWDTPTNIEKKTNYTIYRIPLTAPRGKQSIFFWPVWWALESYWLLTHQWDIVHVADFDCYLPALITSRLRQKKIVYDVFDFYADMVLLPRYVRDIFAFFDKKIMNLADKIIIADKCRLSQIDHAGDPTICVIYNSPNNLLPLEQDVKDRDIFQIFYGGGLQPGRDILSMITVVKDIPNTQIIIAGGGHASEVKKIQFACENTVHASYLGVLPYEDILKYSLGSDLLFALYDPSIPNNKLASPNKLFEAMMCAKPIIVNEGVATADKVREENCGLVVPYGDYNALKEAVLLLKNNPELRNELGRNGRKAYDTKYNWKIMETRLLDLYASLSNENDENKTR